MRLIFSVDRGPIGRVSDIRFDGVKNFTEDELIGVMKSCLKDNWGRYDLPHINYCSQKEARTYMSSAGYFQAKIRIARRRFAKDAVELVFNVDEGIRYRINEISVTGTKVFTDKEVLEMLGVRSGDIANGKKLWDFIAKTLERKYKDQGYIHYSAEFEPRYHPPTLEGLDGTVDIDLAIDEGSQFRVSRIEFSGVEQGQKLLQKFSLKVNEIFSQTKFENDIKKLNESELFNFIDTDRDVEMRVSEESSDIHILIKVTPPIN